jgi:hypothetical protein
MQILRTNSSLISLCLGMALRWRKRSRQHGIRRGSSPGLSAAPLSEEAVEQVLGGRGRGVILRTSWEKPAISVVACWRAMH